jgi:hypothetical protein
MTLLAGDYVVWVRESDGAQTGVLSVMSDSTTNDAKEGLDVGSGGLLQRNMRTLSFMTTWLSELGVDLRAAGWFLIQGDRWDLMKDEPVLEAQVPIAGIQNVTTVTVRRAGELYASETDAAPGGLP